MSVKLIQSGLVSFRYFSEYAQWVVTVTDGHQAITCNTAQNSVDVPIGNIAKIGIFD